MTNSEHSSQALSPAEAARELLSRRRARVNLTHYSERRGFEPAAHHRLLIDRFEALERGDIDRLALFLPPGSAKSTYAMLFQEWLLGRNPHLSLVAVSHTAELAERFGRRVRNAIAMPEYAAIFPGTQLSADSQAAGRWDTTAGGEYFAAGVGGPITGRRADYGLIDDPVRSREDADSERIRETTWQWYLNDFLTRLKPGARQLLIMTRWHEDDLGGRILAFEGEKWTVVCLPMIAQGNDPLGRAVGEPLWPQWYTPDMITRAQADERSWNALYQQNPAPDSGTYFRRDWIGEYDRPPQLVHWYGGSDFAVTDGSGDYTEHGVVGIDANGTMYVHDWWRGQTSPDVWVESMLDLARQHQPMCWFGEGGVIRRAIEPSLMRRMDERRIHARLEWMPSISDKATRARGLQALASRGKLLIRRDMPHRAEVIGQLLRFPAGKHDDAVDALSIAERGAALFPLPVVAAEPPARVDEYAADGAGWMSI